MNFKLMFLIRLSFLATFLLPTSLDRCLAGDMNVNETSDCIEWKRIEEDGVVYWLARPSPSNADRSACSVVRIPEDVKRTTAIWDAGTFSAIEEAVGPICSVVGDGHVNTNDLTSFKSGTAVVLPRSRGSLARRALKGNGNLQVVDLPDSVSSVGSAAFFDCTNLLEVKIGSGLEFLGSGAFCGCERLKRVSFRQTRLKTIGAYAFGACKCLEEIDLPSSVTEIGTGAFTGCRNLKVIRPPQQLKTISAHLFAGCSSLRLVSVPSGVTNIMTCAFCECSSLVSLEFPNTLACVEWFAFSKCPALREMKFYGPPPVCNANRIANESTNLTIMVFSHANQWKAVSEKIGSDWEWKGHRICFVPERL